MSNTEWTTLEFLKIVRETEKAFLVRLDDGAEYWIPKSMIADVGDYEVGETEGEITIKEWFADRMEPAEKEERF